MASGPFFTCRPILPGPFHAFQFIRKFQDAAEATNDDWEKQFKITHQTWDHSPVWFRRNRIAGGNLEFGVQTFDNVYRFLNDGTRLRYMVMTDDFIAKTSPGRFKPGRGHPGPSHFDFNYVAARARAIKERRWDVQVKNRTERHVIRRFQRALEQGVIDSGHKYT